jgi:hypothetical protein
MLLNMTVLKKTNKERDYTPLPSLAFTRSSLDLHLRHLIALGALDAPQCIHIFLFNSRSSASGNLAILLLPSFLVLLLPGNKQILFKYNVA